METRNIDAADENPADDIRATLIWGALFIISVLIVIFSEAA